MDTLLIFYPRINKPYTYTYITVISSSQNGNFLIATVAMITKKCFFPVNCYFAFPMTFHQFIIFVSFLIMASVIRSGITKALKSLLPGH